MNTSLDNDQIDSSKHTYIPYNLMKNAVKPKDYE